MRAAILAAGQGTRLEPITHTIPKCLVPVGGVPLLDRMIGRLVEAGVEEIVVVVGHLADRVREHLAASELPAARGAELVVNDRFAEWGNFYSLLVAQDMLWDDDFIKLDGDVLLGPGLLETLLRAPGPAGVLALDCGVALDAEEMKARVDERGRVVELNKLMDPALARGESIGVERIDAELVPTVFAELRAMIDDGETHEYYERAYERLMQQGVEFTYADISAHLWCEIDDADDLERANSLLASE